MKFETFASKLKTLHKHALASIQNKNFILEGVTAFLTLVFPYAFFFMDTVKETNLIYGILSIFTLFSMIILVGVFVTVDKLDSLTKGVKNYKKIDKFIFIELDKISKPKKMKTVLFYTAAIGLLMTNSMMGNYFQLFIVFLTFISLLGLDAHIGKKTNDRIEQIESGVGIEYLKESMLDKFEKSLDDDDFVDLPKA